MSNQPSFLDSLDAISSEASAAGNTPSVSPAGRKGAKSGQARAPANHLAPPGSAKGRKTRVTSGRSSSASSASVALQQSLANRLDQVMDLRGSMECLLTWKVRVTPARRRIYALRASARPIDGNAFSGWPTPDTQAMGPDTAEPEEGWKRASGANRASTLQRAAWMSSWPTPAAQEFEVADVDRMLERREEVKAKGINGNSFGMSLGMAAQSLSCFPTPQALSFADSHQPGNSRAMNATEEMLRTWATPESNAGTKAPKYHGRGINNPSLNTQALGATSSSSHAETAKPGVLDAAFSRWLQGFPEHWDKMSPNYDAWLVVQERIASGGSRGTEIRLFPK